MPCRDDGYPDPNSKTIDSLRSQLQSQQKKLDQVTRLLCYVCRHSNISEFNPGDKVKRELDAWWLKHQDFDKQRLKKAKESALSKLTEEEKEALGLE